MGEQVDMGTRIGLLTSYKVTPELFERNKRLDATFMHCPIPYRGF